MAEKPRICHRIDSYGKVPKDWPGFDKMNLSPYILGLVRKYGDYTGFYNIQLVCSRDLVAWKRLGNREPFLEASPLGAGAYDIQTIIGPSAPVVRGDELWFYYTGIRQYAFIGSDEDPAYEDDLPDADDKEGRLTTKPFALQGDRLFVNVAVRKNGRLLTEGLDENGKVVATSTPIILDHRRGRVKWNQGHIADLKGEVVSLRFTLRNASLYSYWVDD